MATLQRDLREFVGLLNSHKVDYLVVGGHAVAFHGHPRFTGDIDLLVRMSPEQAGRILAVLTEFGFADLGLTESDLLRIGTVVQLGRAPNRIDLLTSISGVDFERAWTGSVAGELDGIPVRFIGFDDLLTNKRTAGRDQDKADVKKLMAIAARHKRDD
ncbi:MAG TPA: nucleotidyltransferase [Burkholderiales bacterium]|nr:nucleotidyltransferase [Burkholderiales bacterium]